MTSTGTIRAAYFSALTIGVSILTLGLTQCSNQSTNANPVSTTVPIVPDADQASVTTYHYDNSRLGVQSQETSLTPSNVNSTSFGKLFSVSVDGSVFAQPLIVPNITTKDGQPHTLLLVATENDTVYAFDADNASSTPIWQTSLLQTGETPVPAAAAAATGLVGTSVGVTGTPVVDPSQGMIYVVSKSADSTGNYFQRLHALNLQTGSESLNGPTTITATIAGTAPDAVNGQVAFNPLRENQRSALALNNGTIWIAWASHTDTPPYHGWVLGYNSSDISKQSYVFNATPNGGEGGIWMSAGGPAFDTSGNMFIGTGNGDFAESNHNYSSSALKLTAGSSPNGGLTVSDYFTPFNQVNLSAVDADFGTSNNLLLPDQSGSVPHLLVTSDKNSLIYVVNRDNMGKYSSVTNNVVQTFSSTTQNLKQTLAFFNNTLYVSADNSPLSAFSFNPSTGTFQTTPTSVSASVFSCQNCYTGGSAPTISANGTSNGILWAIDNGAWKVPGPAILRAFDPSDLTKELYNSTQAANNRDQALNGLTFTTPVVANGHVYVGGANGVTVYGLLSE